MKVRISFRKSAQENAQEYFEKAKRAKRKREGAMQSIASLKERLEAAEASRLSWREAKHAAVRIRRKEWYELFRWFFSSSGMLAIGGRDAAQNEKLNSRYFTDKDLFFHADVFGASAVILKNGVESDKETREEVAQFAACFSRAWEQGAVATVYSLARGQVSKSKEKGSLGSGSFLLEGEREWYKNVPLQLCAYIDDHSRLCVAPASTRQILKPDMFVEIRPGNTAKNDAAKKLARLLNYPDVDEVLRAIPAGPFSISSAVNRNRAAD
jgi:predicted ribosome quality control (RQC) complex YloA/Tae2 family protein